MNHARRFCLLTSKCNNFHFSILPLQTYIFRLVPVPSSVSLIHVSCFSKETRENVENDTCFPMLVVLVSIKLHHLREPLTANGILMYHRVMAAGMCHGIHHIDCDEAVEELKFTKRLRVFRHNEIYSHVVNSNAELCSH